ncbi:hypothetical protein I3843_10G099800 [Carya illinoinensis]|nr:hypothetical protein I3843_10G099800 [Carya illinoinensis]
MATNEFSGHLPLDMDLFLPKLKQLGLSENKLSGRIPNSISNASQLNLLDLSRNSVSGIIPKALDNLRLLQQLNLEINNLTMGSPESNILSCRIAKISYSLNTFTLSQNKLKGPIPTTLGRLHMLQQSNFPKTSLLRFQLINFHDSFELLERYKSLGDWRYESLEELDLSRNQLSRNIPIIIVVNQLEGSIPKSFEALLYLKYLNVSFKNLQGKIPTGGPFIHFWPALFISNDTLCGAPQLQVPPCEEGSPHRKKAIVSHLLKYLLPAIGLAMLVLAYNICKKGNPEFPQQVDSYNLPTWRRISHQELVIATERFSLDDLLGEGSLGSVYKGILSDGMNIAVKVINLGVEGALKCFDAECEVLRNACHHNLVKIVSVCSNINFKALVLEYMPSENLEKWLYSHDRSLEYLHYGYSTVIVHCDLKPSNVLLDVDMVAHVADFGIAKLFGDEDSMMQTMTLGTLGYMSPEYGLGGGVSTRGDVYSYGILLIETFTRKEPTDDMFVGEMSLKHWVNEALPILAINIVDANLLGNERYHVALEECISSIMRLALDFCVELPEQRTNMKIVLAMLKKIKTKSLRDVEGH